MNEKIYKPGEVAAKIGISIRTLHLAASRTAANRRFYTDLQRNEYFDVSIPQDVRKAICYTRVSSRSQKEDLKNQASMLEQWAVSRRSF